MKGRITLLFVGAVAFAPAARSQSTNPAPAVAKSLVVRVIPVFPCPEQRECARVPEVGGAGVIVGADPRTIYVVTARHVVLSVVQRASDGADTTLRASTVSVRVFGTRDTMPVSAEVFRIDSASRDLAEIRVSRSALPGWQPPAFDRLGNPGRLGFGDPVSPMGCPQGVCWEVPAPADRFVAADRDRIVFQSTFVSGGSSGGALFNARWEVVGLVTETTYPRADAIPIDRVLLIAKEWNTPVDLGPPVVPRDGYHLTLGVTWLSPINGTPTPDSFSVAARVPSGEVQGTWESQHSPITWQVSALRLAPYNLAVVGGMAGAGIAVSAGRVFARPFVEAGIARVDARFDMGGYYLGGSGRYVPVWGTSSQTGVGVGGGADLGLVIAPHVSLTGTIARWSFNMPSNSPSLPPVFVGGGLRWSR